MGIFAIVIQKFLHSDNKKCQVSDTNLSIKPFHLCLLRRGVEKMQNNLLLVVLLMFILIMQDSYQRHLIH